MALKSTVGDIISKLFANTLASGVDVAVPVFVQRKAAPSYNAATGTVTQTGYEEESVNALEGDYDNLTILNSGGSIRLGDKKFSFHAPDLPNGIDVGAIVARGGMNFRVENRQLITNPFDNTEILFYECQCRQVG